MLLSTNTSTKLLKLIGCRATAGKHLCWSLFFIRVAGWELWHKFCTVSKNIYFIECLKKSCFCCFFSSSTLDFKTMKISHSNTLQMLISLKTLLSSTWCWGKIFVCVEQQLSILFSTVQFSSCVIFFALFKLVRIIYAWIMHNCIINQWILYWWIAPPI